MRPVVRLRFGDGYVYQTAEQALKLMIEAHIRQVLTDENVRKATNGVCDGFLEWMNANAQLLRRLGSLRRQRTAAQPGWMKKTFKAEYARLKARYKRVGRKRLHSAAYRRVEEQDKSILDPKKKRLKRVTLHQVERWLAARHEEKRRTAK
jgi:hypothetical protein